MVDEQEIKTCRWLGLLLYASFGTLTPTVGWREGHGPKNLVSPIILLVNGVDKKKTKTVKDDMNKVIKLLSLLHFA